METARENIELNTQAANIIATQQSDILTGLREIIRNTPEGEIATEIDNLGGLGTFGLTLERIADAKDGDPSSITPKNARFVVAFLGSGIIQNYLIERLEGQLSSTDITGIRDYFIAQS